MIDEIELPGMPAMPEANPDPVEPAKSPRRPAKRQPAKRAAKRDTAPKVGRPSNDDKLTESLTAQIVSLSMMLSALGLTTGNPALLADAESVQTHAEPIAVSMVELAKQNPRVRRILESGVTGSAWFGVAIAVGALGRDIASNHAAPAPASEPAPPPAPAPFGR